MATTGELIDSLATDLRPVSENAVAFRLTVGIGAGTAVSGVLMAGWLGLRPDLATAVDTPSFWIKFAYTAILGLAGLRAASRLARPAGDAGEAATAAFLAFGLVVLLAVVQWIATPAVTHPHLLMGQSASVCPWNIVALSAPIFAGAVWAMRGLAPTDLTRAGLAAGLAAGGLGAWVYSFHCGETAMPFLALWYSAGIGAAVAIGAWLSLRALRWQ